MERRRRYLEFQGRRIAEKKFDAEQRWGKELIARVDSLKEALIGLEEENASLGSRLRSLGVRYNTDARLAAAPIIESGDGDGDNEEKRRGEKDPQGPPRSWCRRLNFVAASGYPQNSTPRQGLDGDVDRRGGIGSGENNGEEGPFAPSRQASCPRSSRSVVASAEARAARPVIKVEEDEEDAERRQKMIRAVRKMKRSRGLFRAVDEGRSPEKRRRLQTTPLRFRRGVLMTLHPAMQFSNGGGIERMRPFETGRGSVLVTPVGKGNGCAATTVAAAGDPVDDDGDESERNVVRKRTDALSIFGSEPDDPPSDQTKVRKIYRSVDLPGELRRSCSPADDVFEAGGLFPKDSTTANEDEERGGNDTWLCGGWMPHIEAHETSRSNDLDSILPRDDTSLDNDEGEIQMELREMGPGDNTTTTSAPSPNELVSSSSSRSWPQLGRKVFRHSSVSSLELLSEMTKTCDVRTPCNSITDNNKLSHPRCHMSGEEKVVEASDRKDNRTVEDGEGCDWMPKLSLAIPENFDRNNKETDSLFDFDSNMVEDKEIKALPLSFPSSKCLRDEPCSARDVGASFSQPKTLLSSIPSYQWGGQIVMAATGPQANQMGKVESLGNGLVTVRMFSDRLGPEALSGEGAVSEGGRKKDEGTIGYQRASDLYILEGGTGNAAVPEVRNGAVDDAGGSLNDAKQLDGSNTVVTVTSAEDEVAWGTTGSVEAAMVLPDECSSDDEIQHGGDDLRGIEAAPAVSISTYDVGDCDLSHAHTMDSLVEDVNPCNEALGETNSNGKIDPKVELINFRQKVRSLSIKSSCDRASHITPVDALCGSTEELITHKGRLSKIHSLLPCGMKPPKITSLECNLKTNEEKGDEREDGCNWTDALKEKMGSADNTLQVIGAGSKQNVITTEIAPDILAKRKLITISDKTTLIRGGQKADQTAQLPALRNGPVSLSLSVTEAATEINTEKCISNFCSEACANVAMLPLGSDRSINTSGTAAVLELHEYNDVPEGATDRLDNDSYSIEREKEISLAPAEMNAVTKDVLTEKLPLGDENSERNGISGEESFSVSLQKSITELVENKTSAAAYSYVEGQGGGLASSSDLERQPIWAGDDIPRFISNILASGGTRETDNCRGEDPDGQENEDKGTIFVSEESIHQDKHIPTPKLSISASTDCKSLSCENIGLHQAGMTSLEDLSYKKGTVDPTLGLVTESVDGGIDQCDTVGSKETEDEEGKIGLPKNRNNQTQGRGKIMEVEENAAKDFPLSESDQVAAAFSNISQKSQGEFFLYESAIQKEGNIPCSNQNYGPDNLPSNQDSDSKHWTLASSSDTNADGTFPRISISREDGGEDSSRHDGTIPLKKSVGRTRKWLNENQAVRKYLFSKFCQGSFGTRTCHGVMKISHVVINDQWNDLVSSQNSMQHYFIGTGPVRAKQGHALASISQDENAVPLFFSYKKSTKSILVFYVGHWIPMSSETYTDGNLKEVKGKPRQMYIKLKFVRFDDGLANAIATDSLIEEKTEAKTEKNCDEEPCQDIEK